MARVEIQNLGKLFVGTHGEPVWAVRGASLAVEDGELLVLVGPSGAGKSTVLRLIAGLEQAHEGDISIDDEVVNHVPPQDRDIAMVFQNHALYPHMTVGENLAFGLKLRKFPQAETAKRVREAAALLGLSSLLDRQPAALSGGERQRVALGRALVRQPKVFLFDEPLSNLDARLREQLRAEILRQHQRLGATMILVTHDQAEAMTMGDRIAVMDRGVIQQVAPPLTVYHEPANLFVAGFFGAPAMNFVPGRLVEHAGATWFEAEAESSEAANHVGFVVRLTPAQTTDLAHLRGRSVVLGLRPEHVQCGRESAANETCPAMVEWAETTGAELFLRLKSAGLTLTARVSPMSGIDAGERIFIHPVMAQARFFDADSRRRVF
ncbi:MAG: ABC transporter ATP-binding protein [Verrucomicrobia bacterium]|nr:ABC transporter ATP-binding protein [Verrucomicrobiota bacterium]